MTKFVVDTFLPVIDLFLLAIQIKPYKVIIIEAQQCSLKARIEGFYKLCCWFTVLRDVVDVALFVADAISKGNEDASYAPLTTIKAAASHDDSKRSSLSVTESSSGSGKASPEHHRKHRFSDPVFRTQTGTSYKSEHEPIAENEPVMPAHHLSTPNEIMEFQEFSDDELTPRLVKQTSERINADGAVEILTTYSSSVKRNNVVDNDEDDDGLGDLFPSVATSIKNITPIKSPETANLPPKCVDILSDMIDNIEIAIWDAAVEDFS